MPVPDARGAPRLATQVLRREIHDGLQVVEHWNSANTVIFYGKDSELTGAARETQEILMRALHVLQSALVHSQPLCREWVIDHFQPVVGCHAYLAVSLGRRSGDPVEDRD